MSRLWDIRLKREHNGVCIDLKEISPFVAISAGRMRGAADLGLLMTTSSRACFQIPALPPIRNAVRLSRSWRRNTGIEVQNNQRKLEKYSESSSSPSAKRDALRNMVLLRWSVGAVGAGSIPGGGVGRGESGLAENWLGVGGLSAGGLGVGGSSVGELRVGV